MSEQLTVAVVRDMVSNCKTTGGYVRVSAEQFVKCAECLIAEIDRLTAVSEGAIAEYLKKGRECIALRMETFEGALCPRFDILGKWPGDETDEEIQAGLEAVE